MNGPDKLEYLSLAKHCQPSLMFVSNAGAYPSRAPSYSAGYLPFQQALYLSGSLVSDNYYSLFGRFISYKAKKKRFVKTAPANF
jgi:hypothetical protein